MPDDGGVTLLFLLFLSVLLASLSATHSSPLLSLSFELCTMLSSRLPPAVQYTTSHTPVLLFGLILIYITSSLQGI